MDGATESRNGKILLSIIENTPYTDQPQSRIEELLIELKEIIEAEDRAALVEIIDNGDKNKLQNTLTSGTVKGITYTINADGSITTAAGTATGGNSNLVISLSLPAGRYVLSGCPDGGSGTTYRAQVLDNTTSASAALVTDSTEGNEFEVVAGHDYAWRFRVQEGKSIPAATFYPMICSLAAWKISTQYQPYRPSWQEMWEMIQALQSGGASTQSASHAALMSAKSAIEPDVMPEEGEKQDE